MTVQTTKQCESCSKPLKGEDAYRRRFCSRGCAQPPARGTPGKGAKDGAKRRTVVIFDEDQFAEIRQCAVDRGTSFAEQVRLLCEWGLEA